MNWTIEFDEKAKNDLLKLDKPVRKRILKFIQERLLKYDNPRSLEQPLKGEFLGLWKYRIGDYRLICHLEDKIMTILILAIGHRRKIYHL